MTAGSYDAIRRQGALAPVVIIATKGRAPEVTALLPMLAGQSLRPGLIVIVGTEPADLPDTSILPDEDRALVHVLTAPQPGLTRQRNVGLDWIAANGLLGESAQFVAFFDDDFRPSTDWLEGASRTFLEAPDIVGVTGWVLADGIRGPGLSEAQAQAHLDGRAPPEDHWTARDHGHRVESAYGCNMAFRHDAARACRFDEALPLYGWQEDTDFTGQTRTLGRTVISQHCRGVHLGVKSARNSGLKLGYSQIANPIHIAGRGNMRWKRAMRFVLRALVSNTVNSVRGSAMFDYPGRLRGNLRALGDLVTGRCEPQRILKL